VPASFRDQLAVVEELLRGHVGLAGDEPKRLRAEGIV
jgi:hypothetical protein